MTKLHNSTYLPIQHHNNNYNFTNIFHRPFHFHSKYFPILIFIMFDTILLFNLSFPLIIFAALLLIFILSFNFLSVLLSCNSCKHNIYITAIKLLDSTLSSVSYSRIEYEYIVGIIQLNSIQSSIAHRGM